MSTNGAAQNGGNGTPPPSGTSSTSAAAAPASQPAGQRLDHHGNPVPDHYKWIALSNTTLGVLIATINASILLISLPNIFKGININPLLPSNTNYLLWLILGFLVVTAVLVVSLGRLGDIYGRARTYNLGFAVFTFFSILLSVTWMKGSSGAMWLIIMRALQGVGGAMLFANSSAIITDAFPANQRGLALGINGVAAVAGSSIGLVLGGVLAPVAWRAVFLVSVPFGIFGTIWGFAKLRDLSERKPAKIDWWGNLTFAVGLIAVMIGITYGIQPYGHHTMGWTSPQVIAEIGGGLIILVIFCFIETRVEQPMFHLDLFKVRAFTAGNFASLLSGIGRGGLQFVLIIWLQGIYLPRHGYSFANTPLWAGIYLLPLVAGMLVAGPIAGALSDRLGPRPFAASGMALAAISFLLLALLPVNFSYPVFALVIILNGIGMGIFFSPNRASIMNSLPANQRGAGGGMAATFMNSAMVLSIGIFFSLMIVGLSGGLHTSLYNGLTAHGVSHAVAAKAANLPPVATLFAAFLGYNPIQTLLGPGIHAVSAHQQHILLGHTFFPSVISAPFASALSSAFTFGLIACLVAGLASLVPAKGQPLIGRRRQSAAPAGGGENDLMVIPAGATLEYAGADVGDPGDSQ
ncbi:MAG TPA: MFS transporter [Solirubrobacteraceae bacterium]|nr:MFS transporter [Solirubrobacteraceae bacterium]